VASRSPFLKGINGEIDVRGGNRTSATTGENNRWGEAMKSEKTRETSETETIKLDRSPNHGTSANYKRNRERSLEDERNIENKTVAMDLTKTEIET